MFFRDFAKHEAENTFIQSCFLRVVSQASIFIPQCSIVFGQRFYYCVDQGTIGLPHQTVFDS